jgi:hypothetical protein
MARDRGARRRRGIACLTRGEAISRVLSINGQTELTFDKWLHPQCALLC